MRGVDLSVAHHRPVEVNDWAALVLGPSLHQRAGLLFVFGDGRVVDRVEEPRVDTDALSGIGDRKLRDLGEGGLGRNDNRRDEERHHRAGQNSQSCHSDDLTTAAAFRSWPL
jgi:hypothetical protein